MIPRLVHSSPIQLIDGPLINVARNSLVARMAAVLVRKHTFGDEVEARFSLRCAGFSMAEIVMCIDDARQVAMQHVVAMEMSAPDDPYCGRRNGNCQCQQVLECRHHAVSTGFQSETDHGS